MSLENKYRSIVVERKQGDQWSTVAWIQIGTAYEKGYIQKVSGSEVFQTGKAGEKVEFRMFCPMNTVELFYGDRITQDGKKYIVLTPWQPVGISSESHHKEIMLGGLE